MSLPRSIDVVDAGSISVPITGTETVVAVGPRLQTPKDTSVVLIQACVYLTGISGAGAATISLRQGTTTAGPLVQPQYQFSTVAGEGSLTLTAMWTQSVSQTDYVQYSLTVNGSGATFTCSRAVLHCISF